MDPYIPHMFEGAASPKPDGDTFMVRPGALGYKTVGTVVSSARPVRLDGVQPGDWLNSLTSEQRKKIPLGQVMQHYWPDALAMLAYHSFKGNEKHNPGERLHWARDKSTDHEDCVARHLVGAGGRDADGLRHTAGLAWRAMCMLQLEIEAAYARGEEVF